MHVLSDFVLLGCIDLCFNAFWVSVHGYVYLCVFVTILCVCVLCISACTFCVLCINVLIFYVYGISYVCVCACVFLCFFVYTCTCIQEGIQLMLSVFPNFFQEGKLRRYK